ncbi:MAG: type I restriction-modification system subunit M N-terminal domain-containing protein [Planctomycetales bacterium]
MAKKRAKKATSANGNGANLGFEQTLWLAADKLRNNLDAAEYKHVVLGLIFLKYISDAFAERHAKDDAEKVVADFLRLANLIRSIAVTT